MAGLLHFTVLLYSCCGLFALFSSGLTADRPVRPTVAPGAAFTSTESICSAGKCTTTDSLATGFPTNSSKSTTKTITTTQRLTGDADQTAEKREPQTVNEEQEGPLELGKFI